MNPAKPKTSATAVLALALGLAAGWWLGRDATVARTGNSEPTPLPDLRRTPPPVDPKAVTFEVSAADFSTWSPPGSFHDAVARREWVRTARLSPAVRALADQWAADAMVRHDAPASLSTNAGAAAVRALLGDGPRPDWDQLVQAVETHEICRYSAVEMAGACSASEAAFVLADRLLEACRMRTPAGDGVMLLLPELVAKASRTDPKGTLAWLDRVDASHGTHWDRDQPLLAYARLDPAAADAIAAQHRNFSEDAWVARYWAARCETDPDAVRRAAREAAQAGIGWQLEAILEPRDGELSGAALALLPTDPKERAKMVEWLRGSIRDRFDVRAVTKMRHVFSDDEWQQLEGALNHADEDCWGLFTSSERVRSDGQRTPVSWDDVAMQVSPDNALFSLKEMAKAAPARAAALLETLEPSGQNEELVAMQWAVIDPDAALQWHLSRRRSGSESARAVSRDLVAAFAGASVANIVRWMDAIAPAQRQSVSEQCFDVLLANHRFDKAARFVQDCRLFRGARQADALARLAAARAETPPRDAGKL